jgi:hypothetical protein
MQNSDAFLGNSLYFRWLAGPVPTLDYAVPES